VFFLAPGAVEDAHKGLFSFPLNTAWFFGDIMIIIFGIELEMGMTAFRGTSLLSFRLRHKRFPARITNYFSHHSLTFLRLLSSANDCL
jgi:hypothetical protein